VQPSKQSILECFQQAFVTAEATARELEEAELALSWISGEQVAA
jgi:hypothetical protein